MTKGPTARLRISSRSMYTSYLRTNKSSRRRGETSSIIKKVDFFLLLLYCFCSLGWNQCGWRRIYTMFSASLCASSIMQDLPWLYSASLPWENVFFKLVFRHLFKKSFSHNYVQKLQLPSLKLETSSLNSLYIPLFLFRTEQPIWAAGG